MTREKQQRTLNGWAMLGVTIGIFVIAAVFGYLFLRSAVHANAVNGTPNLWLLAATVLTSGVGVFLCFGFFTLQPNEGRVLILFGAYRGTVRTAGWHWTNPLNTKLRLSLRSRNFNSDKLKVNDKRGNPIEIAVVVVAVTMVEMALSDLSKRQVVQLDEERKAAMVSNLLVVLCGEQEAHPVINTGTLYG